MNKYITEFIGTFFLVMGATLGGAPGAALALMIMVYAGGHTSGGYYNPAVTLSVWMRGRIEMKDAFMYWIFQFAGAVVAALVVVYVFKEEGAGNCIIPDDGGTKAIVAELLGTFALAYVVLNVATAKGTSGKWEVLFPSAKAGTDNRIEANKSYDIPPSTVMSFDEKSGTEKLFVVLSRQPEKDLEGLTYSLQKVKPKRNEISGPMVASNMPVQDDVVQRLRNTYSRDLLIESVDDSKKTPSAAEKTVMSHAKITGEKAVYIVNPSVEPTARLVADIQLQHAGKQ